MYRYIIYINLIISPNISVPFDNLPVSFAIPPTIKKLLIINVPYSNCANLISSILKISIFNDNTNKR